MKAGSHPNLSVTQRTGLRRMVDAGSDPCILVADDDPLNLMALRVQLEYLGYRVDTVQDGQEVLVALQKRHYRLLIIDMYMGETDGLATTLKIRQSMPAEKQPYIAILTGGVTRSELDALRQAGIDQYIEKPVMLQKLKALLEHVCQEKQTPVPAGPPEAEGEPAGAAPQETVDFLVLEELLKMNRQRPGDQSVNFLDMFFQSMPDLMNSIKELARQAAYPELVRQLHAFRSSSEIYGASRLAGLCRQLEKELNQERPPTISTQIDTIEAEFIRVAQLLRNSSSYGVHSDEPGSAA